MTETPPRNYDNSLYHAFNRDGAIYLSDGTRRGKLSETAETDLNAWELTKVFQGDPDNVAWMCDVELDAARRAYVIFTVQKDGRGLPRGQGGFDHRFDYARWDGSAWRGDEIPVARPPPYYGGGDHTGTAPPHPNQPDRGRLSAPTCPPPRAPPLRAPH